MCQGQSPVLVRPMIRSAASTKSSYLRQCSQSFGRAPTPDRVQDPRGVVLAIAAAEPAHRPLAPGDRDAEEQEADDIGDHEGAAAVVDGLPGKAEEIAQPDGGAGHRQHDAELRAPVFPLR